MEMLIKLLTEIKLWIIIIIDKNALLKEIIRVIHI